MTVPFIPCQDFELSIQFYEALGFKIGPIHEGQTRTCYVEYEDNGIILQDYYIKDFAENFMMTLHVSNLGQLIKTLEDGLNTPYLQAKYNGPKDFGWGMQIHLLDPTGVLLHIFQKK